METVAAGASPAVARRRGARERGHSNCHWIVIAFFNGLVSLSPSGLGSRQPSDRSSPTFYPPAGSGIMRARLRPSTILSANAAVWRLEG